MHALPESQWTVTKFDKSMRSDRVYTGYLWSSARPDRTARVWSSARANKSMMDDRSTRTWSSKSWQK